MHPVSSTHDTLFGTCTYSSILVSRFGQPVESIWVLVTMYACRSVSFVTHINTLSSKIKASQRSSFASQREAQRVLSVNNQSLMTAVCKQPRWRSVLCRMKHLCNPSRHCYLYLFPLRCSVHIETLCEHKQATTISRVCEMLYWRLTHGCVLL